MTDKTAPETEYVIVSAYRNKNGKLVVSKGKKFKIPISKLKKKR